MARKEKMVVDYFPHFVNDGKTILILESKFGNDGYAFWFKVLELLGKSPKHFIDCRDVFNFDFLIAKTKVEDKKAIEILDLLAKLNAIDKDLWELKIIFSQNFLNNLETLYSRRNTETITKQEIIDNINNLSVVLMPTEILLDKDNPDKNTQRKGKDSKGKDSNTLVTNCNTEKEKENIKRTWNDFAKQHDLNQIMKLTEKRISSIRQRLSESEFDFEKILGLIEKSDFLLGKKTDWKVDFDFIFCSKNNYIKIMEEKYSGLQQDSKQGKIIEYNPA